MRVQRAAWLRRRRRRLCVLVINSGNCKSITLEGYWKRKAKQFKRFNFLILDVNAIRQMTMPIKLCAGYEEQHLKSMAWDFYILNIFSAQCEFDRKNKQTIKRTQSKQPSWSWRCGHSKVATQSHHSRSFNYRRLARACIFVCVCAREWAMRFSLVSVAVVDEYRILAPLQSHTIFNINLNRCVILDCCHRCFIRSRLISIRLPLHMMRRWKYTNQSISAAPKQSKSNRYRVQSALDRGPSSRKRSIFISAGHIPVRLNHTNWILATDADRRHRRRRQRSMRRGQSSQLDVVVRWWDNVYIRFIVVTI